ncbi:MAG: spermidine synthase [Flavobacteriales bacterium]|jgi:spermidine synthase/predicted MFS family arabinose efflux permease|nr:spermidine synthase [Flavobacteriales bacterium]
MERSQQGRFARTLVLSLFFLSGFAALLYQVAWQRMLVFYTGSDTVSISLIVTAFMSGLGLGYLVGGRLADANEPRRNLMLFVAAELGIMLFAAGSKHILYDWLYLSASGAHLGTMGNMALVFLVLLLPTFLMGLSLPVLSRAFRLSAMSQQARYISSLYFINTLGAGIGALVTGVVLVRAFGYSGSIWLGVALNAACAIGAVVLALRRPANGADARECANAVRLPLRATPALVAWSAHYAISGFAALSLELIWFRVLETMIKSVALTFSILLAIYLVSMAIGTAVGGRMAASRGILGRERLFLRAQMLLYGSMAFVFLALLAVIWRTDAFLFLREYLLSYEPDLRPRMLLCTYVIVPLFLMFLPTFLMGMSFSVSQAIVQDRFEEVGRKVGWLQFVNIVGSAAGAWCITWVGFRSLGTAPMIKAIALIGLVYAAVSFKRHARERWSAGFYALVLVVMVAVLPGNQELWMRLSGMELKERFICEENESGLSIIKRYDRGKGLVGVVFANGLGQSIMPYHQDLVHARLGALPVLLHPNPVHVAVIGLGSGGTVYGISSRPETRRITCFEIMSNQALAVRAYADRVGDSAIVHLLEDPRLRLVAGDGRYQLRASAERYDVIEADALRPNSSYSGNIYSKQYFELLRERLLPGGYAVTWCPTPRVRRTFCSVFTHVAEVPGFLLIGSEQPIVIDWRLVNERLQDPFTRARFDLAGIDAAALLDGMEERLGLIDPAEVPAEDINLDLHPRDEHELPYSQEMIKRKLREALFR